MVAEHEVLPPPRLNDSLQPIIVSVGYDLAVRTIKGLSGAVNWPVGYGIFQLYSIMDADGVTALEIMILGQ
jgi:hypothetical protein